MREEWFVEVNHSEVLDTSQVVELVGLTIKELVAQVGAFN